MLTELLLQLEQGNFLPLYKKTKNDILKDYPELNELIVNIELGNSFREKLYLLVFKEQKKCYCGNKTKFSDTYFKYLDFCSKSCSNNSNELNDKKNKNREQTNFKKFGVAQPSQLQRIKEKVKETMIKKFGEEYGKEMFKKTSETLKKTHGVENCSKLSVVKQKKKAKSLEKYGVDNVFKSEEVKQKIKEANIDKHGEIPGFGSKAYNKAIKEKYGVENISHHLPTFEKRMHSAKKFKEYFLPSGKLVLIQGFENKVLDYLFEVEQINENDIFISNKDIENEIGKIFYVKEDKQKRYYPDFYIKSKNLLIEVKSEFTAKLNINNLEEKKEACIRLGFNYLIYIPIPEKKIMLIKKSFKND